MSDLFNKLRPHGRWFPLQNIDNNDSESKQRLIERLLACQDLFDTVRAFIHEQEQSLDRGEESLDDFRDGAWPYKQAFRAGQRSAYKEVKSFLPDPNKRKKSE